MSTLTPVLSAVIAASAALLGVYLTQRQARLTMMMQRNEREESEWARRREEAAQAVGPVLSLLADADIATFVTSRQFKADPDEARRELSGNVLEQLLVIIDRWPALREKLLILATSHPSFRVHELTLALIDATSDLLARCYFYFGEFSRIDAVDPRVVPLASGLRLERAYDLERTPDEPATSRTNQRCGCTARNSSCSFAGRPTHWPATCCWRCGSAERCCSIDRDGVCVLRLLA